MKELTAGKTLIDLLISFMKTFRPTINKLKYLLLKINSKKHWISYSKSLRSLESQKRNSYISLLISHTNKILLIETMWLRFWKILMVVTKSLVFGVFQKKPFY